MSPETVKFLLQILDSIQISATDPNLVATATAIQTARTELTSQLTE